MAGVMTRKPDSDSTLPSEEEKRMLEILSPHRPGEGGNMLDPLHAKRWFALFVELLCKVINIAQ